MLIFFFSLLCSILFVATANADVTIEGEPNSYNVSIGDTLSVTSRKSLQVGENFVKWEIVSGTGTFVDETEDSTGFIPSSDPVVIRRVTRTLPIYEISDKMTKFIVGFKKPEDLEKVPGIGKKKLEGLLSGVIFD